ncbi:alpha/beta hydrolase [Streptomyces sp. P1-3]|uniref:alpha/beta hydrolase n=1 Tax=Streptomyces sp. P1-3 TaxID=3421658 RepID=UPI003D36819A
MGQQTLPEREARLGRPMGAAAGGRTTHGVVLVLPGGAAEGTRRGSWLAALNARPLARELVKAGAADGLTAHVVRYRYHGWNGSAAHPVADASWAADEVVRRYGDVPVCLAGHDIGARAALRAAGHPAVASVLALAPWIPEREAVLDPDPVKQLAGRRVLIVHGTDDERTCPDLSYRFAERAKKANRDVCRFEVHTEDHSFGARVKEVLALSADFALGSLFGHGFSRPLTDALAAPPPLGLRMPLAVGFRRTRH